MICRRASIVSVGASHGSVYNCRSVSASYLRLVRRFFTLYLLRIKIRFAGIRFRLLRDFNRFLRFRFKEDGSSGTFQHLLYGRTASSTRLLVLMTSMNYLRGLFYQFKGDRLRLNEVIRGIADRLLCLDERNNERRSYLPLFEGRFSGLRGVIVGSRIRRPIYFVRGGVESAKGVCVAGTGVNCRAPQNDGGSVDARYRPSFLLLRRCSIVATVRDRTKGQRRVERAFRLLICLLHRLTNEDRSGTVSNVNEISTL